MRGPIIKSKCALIRVVFSFKNYNFFKVKRLVIKHLIITEIMKEGHTDKITCKVALKLKTFRTIKI